MNIQIPLVIAISYIIGAIPFGWLIGKIFFHKDLRDEGSGGIGATNVGRSFGKPAAFLTFFLDTMKGTAIVLLARHYFQLDAPTATGMGLVGAFGHCFPIVLGGKGGKAVATSLGVLLASQWQVGLIAFAIWGVVVLFTGIVSVASLAAAISLIVMQWWVQVRVDPVSIHWIFTAIAVLVIAMHVPNIKRLIKREEPRFQFKGGDKDAVI